MSTSTKKTTVEKTTVRPNKSKKNRQRRLRKRNAKKAAKTTFPVFATGGMDKCAEDYAKVLVNPFGARNIKVCVPDLKMKESFKTRVRITGTFSTGTTGVGWVAFNPWLAIINNGGNSSLNTSYPVLYTTKLYEQESYFWEVTGAVFTTGVAGANSDSIFTTEKMNQDNPRPHYRLVAAGLRITYSGSTFRNQGSVYLYRDPTNEDILHNDDSYNGSWFMRNEYTAMIPVARKPEYVFYSPTDTDDWDYNHFSYYDPNVGSLRSKRSLLIYIEGGDIESPQNWNFEAVAYFEVTGSGMPLSPSHSDVESAGKILASLPRKNPTEPPQAVEASLLTRVTKEIGKQAGNVLLHGTALAAQYAAGYGKRMLNNYMNPQPVYTITDVDEI